MKWKGLIAVAIFWLFIVGVLVIPKIAAVVLLAFVVLAGSFFLYESFS